jgi:hypothetical protein
MFGCLVLSTVSVPLTEHSILLTSRKDCIAESVIVIRGLNRTENGKRVLIHTCSP